MDPAAPSLESARRLIVEGLRSRSTTITQAIRTRVEDVAGDAASADDPAYEQSLVDAIDAIVRYTLDAIDHGAEWAQPIPKAAAAQARRAARLGISVGTVQRRYIAGHRELGDFVAEEIERSDLANNGDVIRHLRTIQEALLEHLAAAVEREYNDEQELVAGSNRSAIIERLLAGEQATPAELTDLGYEIEAACHVGLIASGAGIEELLEALKKRYARRLLHVLLNERMWAWINTQEPYDEDFKLLADLRPGDTLLAVGEPGRGLGGWRLTHKQAQAAFGIALRKPDKVAFYAHARLLAAALQNDTLIDSLIQTYLLPLSGQSDGGVKLRRTLRTYIDLECNATSASHQLRVGRHTVERHVHLAEQLLGCSLRACLPELDVALGLEELRRGHAGS